MNIAMVSSEIGPFAKTGGLADVVNTLAAALERRGHDLTLVMPAYQCVLQGDFERQETDIKLRVSLGGNESEATVLKSRLGRNISVYFIRADSYFEREFLYGTPAGDYPDNAERFTFFSRAALELLCRQRFDIVHCHDWQTALVIVFLKTQGHRYGDLAAARCVFTVHNLGFQGNFSAAHWPMLNLDDGLFTFPYLEFYGTINFLKGALVFADKITTVSPSYAQEIVGSEQGFGLEGVLRQRSHDVVGILNGVDYGLWNPWVDPFISPHYGEHSLTAKRDCKRNLQRAMGLPERGETPLFGMISRLTSQKGLDLIEAIFDRLIERQLQLVVLGSGEPRYQQFFANAAERFPTRVAAHLGFNEALAHQIEAGADFFLMPSLYEPCGLNQMFSLKYGTVPIVRSIGGLKDTVADYDPERDSGTGLVFGPYQPEALFEAVQRALNLFQNKRAWTSLRRRAMGMDFSWSRSAEAYDALYRQLVSGGGTTESQ